MTKEPDELLPGYLDFGVELAAERTYHRGRARLTLLTFVEVMDSLDRFLTAAGEDCSFPHLRSVRLIAKQHQDALSRAGAIPMQCQGRLFEAGRHEIVSSRTVSGVAEDTILEEVTRGYADEEGEVIRKARVIVAAASRQE